MRKHGEFIDVDLAYNLPINVCSNPECGQEFILLSVRPERRPWVQVGNRFGGLHCPYCKEKVGADYENKIDSK